MENSIISCNFRPHHPSLPTTKPENPPGKTSKPNYISLTKKTPPISELQLTHLSKTGNLKEAVTALDSIIKNGFKLKPETYISLLEACIDSNSISEGKLIHTHVDSVLKISSNPFVETKLVSMYAKCGSLEDARQVFDKMSERNLFAWSAMIGAYAREQRWEPILQLFVQMVEEGLIPDGFLFTKIIQACANLGDVKTGKSVHSIVIQGGFDDYSIHVWNSLLAMYAKCRELSSACKLFDKMPQRDLVSWNSMISGYCQCGKNEEALMLFDQMQIEGIEPSVLTWNILLSNYNQSGYCDVAMEMMQKMVNSGTVLDVFTWTIMISGFAQNDRTNQALDLFREMLVAGTKPNGVTIASAISACSSLKAFRKGLEIHSIAVKLGSTNDVLVGNSLIDMYAKCGKLEAAERVFSKISSRDVFTWNSMIGAYTQAGYCGKAYDLFSKMQNLGIKQNVVTWNVMISGYMQNADEDRALELFDRMERDGVKRNKASWNALIAGYLQNGHGTKALGMFRQMQSSLVKPNSVTILSALPACTILTCEKKVREIHCCVICGGLESELSIANCLIDTYAKSGDIASARSVFDNFSSKDLISWNSMISGYVLHGNAEMALDLFEQMKLSGIEPNQTTFASAISAYGLLGMVESGKQLLCSMTEDYKTLPNLNHFTAMVELLGRSGRLGEAVDLIEKMPIEPDSGVWSSLLVACRVHGNTKLATQALEHLIKLEPGNSVIYRLLWQMYDLAGKPDESSRMKKPKDYNGAIKALGLSYINVENMVHAFVAGDRSMPYLDCLYSKLDDMAEEIKNKGFHHPNTHLLRIEEEEEETTHGGFHSEKLAIAFALIRTPTPRSIRIVKSLRMCAGCHSFAKLVSGVFRRGIFLKDPKRLHHFKNGQCSCRDYW